MNRNEEEEAKKAKKRQQDKERQRRQRERNKNKNKQEKELKKAAGSKKSKRVKKAEKEFDALVEAVMESEDSEDSEHYPSEKKSRTEDEKRTAEVMESEDSEDSENNSGELKPRAEDKRQVAAKLGMRRLRAKNKKQEEEKRQREGLPVQPSVVSRVEVVAKEKASYYSKRYRESHQKQESFRKKLHYEENKGAYKQRVRDYNLLNRDRIIERKRVAREVEKNKKNYPNFERDIDEAREVLADLTGFDYWKLPGEVTDEQFIQQLEDRIVTRADTNPCIAKVVNEIHLNVPVYDCACCGRKELGTLSSRFKEKDAKNKRDSGRIVDLNNPHDRDFIRALEVRETNEEVLSVKGTKKMRPTAPYALFYRQYFQLFEKEVSLAKEKGAEDYEIKKNYLRVFNHYEYKEKTKSGKVNIYRYALHPELISRDLKCRICKKCEGYLSKKRSTIPPFSIRAGYDFGNLARIGLPNLSDVAKVVLGQCSGFGASVFKLKQRDQRVAVTEDNIFSAVTGHFIVFSPQLVEGPSFWDAVNTEDKTSFKNHVINNIGVSFVGSIPSWNIVQNGIIQGKILSRIFSLDVKSIKPWIDYLSFRGSILLKTPFLQGNQAFNNGSEYLFRLLQLNTATGVLTNQDDMNDILKGILEKCQVCRKHQEVDCIDRRGKGKSGQESGPTSRRAAISVNRSSCFVIEDRSIVVVVYSFDISDIRVTTIL